MAYGVKFELFFSDLEDRQIKVEILKKDYLNVDGGETETIFPLIGTENPVQITWESDDDIYSPIIGSRCKLNLYATTLTQYDEFYKADEREYKIKVYYYNSYGDGAWEDEKSKWELTDVNWDAKAGSALWWDSYWEGFIVVDRYQEMVTTTPFPLTFEAIDGLGTLSGFDAPNPFKLNSLADLISGDERITTDGEKSLFFYITEILKKTGHQFDIYIANDTRKVGGATNDTIFHDILVNEIAMLNPNKFTYRTAKELLERILKATNSRIFQSYGKWYIVNNSSLIDNRITQSTVSASGDDISVDPTPVADNGVPTFGEGESDPPVSVNPVVAPDITLNGAVSKMAGTGFFFTLLKSGGAPTSTTWTLPDGTTQTTSDSYPTFSFPATTSISGGTVSVSATNSAGTDSDSSTITVSAFVSSSNTGGTLRIFFQESGLIGASGTPTVATINYQGSEVGNSFSVYFNVMPSGGEFTGVSQISASVTGGYTVAKSLIGEFIRITVSGTLPNGGANEYLTVSGSALRPQTTTTVTINDTTTNTTKSAGSLTFTGASDDSFSGTVTFTPNTNYDFDNAGRLSTLFSAGGIASLNKSVVSNNCVITIFGNIGATDQSVTLNVSGSPQFAAVASSISINPSGVLSVGENGGTFNIIVSSNGKYGVNTTARFLRPSIKLGNPSNTIVTITFLRNNGSSRSGTINFTPYASSSTLVSLRVDQDGIL